METKVCKKCKKEFTPSKPKEKYCERCKNELANKTKKGALLVGGIGTALLTVLTLGKKGK